jgi:hypothetical protein
VHGALLVADEDVAQRVLLEDLVIDREDGAAGIAEDMLDALVDQGPEHHLRADHFLRCHESPSILAITNSHASLRAARLSPPLSSILHQHRLFVSARAHLHPRPAASRTPTPEPAR